MQLALCNLPCSTTASGTRLAPTSLKTILNRFFNARCPLRVQISPHSHTKKNKPAQKCELILSGVKIREIRKSVPKLIEVPFRCYIYCTKDEPLYDSGYKCWVNKAGEFGNGKVVGEFVCDQIDKFERSFFDEQEALDTDEISELLRYSCLSYSELCAYVGEKLFYSWHISDLVVYDDLKTLKQFCRCCPPDVYGCNMCKYGDSSGMRCRPIKCPASFMYAELRR